MALLNSHVHFDFKGIIGITWLRYHTVLNVWWPKLFHTIYLCVHLCVCGGREEE